MSRTQYATLHSGLLSRKGEAEPAARPLHAAHGLGMEGTRRDIQNKPSGAPHAPAQTMRLSAAAAHDAAHADDDTAVTPPPGMPPMKSGNGSKAPAKRRIHMSLRLTPDQHRRLKIATAQLGCSYQRLLSDALDTHLANLAADELGDCRCLRRRKDKFDF